MSKFFVGGTASVYVSSMEAAIHFYTKLLGLNLITRIKEEWVEIDCGNGFIIGLHPAQPNGMQPGTNGAINIELRVDESNSLVEVVNALKSKGAQFEGGILNFEHVRLASMLDPDKNIILLAQNVKG